MNRRKLITGITTSVLVLTILATSARRAVILTSLVQVAEVGAKILRLPCWIVYHSKCFTLDRLNPTCPPYL